MCKKRFSSFNLFIFFKKIYIFIFSFISFFKTVHSTYSFQRRKRDPDLLREKEVVPLEKYLLYTFDVLIKVSPLTLLYLTELTRVNPKQPIRVDGTN